ncbi:hypothetical protein OXX80_008736 [Metschnikowia pulcherrima]
MTPVTAFESRPDSGNQNHILNLIGAVQQTGTDNAFAATPETVRANSGENTTDPKINDSSENIHGTEDFSNPTNTQEERDEISGHGPIRTGSEHGSLEHQPGSHEAITGSIDENNNLVRIFSRFENARENGETRLFQNQGSTRSAQNAHVDTWLQETFDAGQNISFQEYIAEEAELADVCSSSSDEGEPTLCDFELIREVTREYEITEERAQIMDDLEDLIGRHRRETPQQIHEPNVAETICSLDESIEFEGFSRFFRKLSPSRLKRKVVEWVRKVRAAAKSSGGMFQPDVHVETAFRGTLSSISETPGTIRVSPRVSPQSAADLRMQVLRDNFIHHMAELREARRLANATQRAQRFDVREFSPQVQASRVAVPEISIQTAEPEIFVQASEPEIPVNAAESRTSMEATEQESSTNEIEPEFKQNYVTWIEGFSGFRRTTRKKRTRRSNRRSRRSSRNDTSVPQRVHFGSLPEPSQPLNPGSSDSGILEEISSRPTFSVVVSDEVPVFESSSASGTNYGSQIFNSLDEDSHVEEGSIDSEDYDT